MIGVSAFEAGNIAATLLILRATELLPTGARTRSRGGSEFALLLYALYNLAATLASVPAGGQADKWIAAAPCWSPSRRRRVAFLAAYVGFAATGGASLVILGLCFGAGGDRDRVRGDGRARGGRYVGAR